MAPGIALQAVSHSRRQLRVLDPMMGSGTVLAAARAKGHHAIGVDIDPLAVLIARVWTKSIDKRSIVKVAKKVLARARNNVRSLSYREAYPAGADPETRAFIRYWFDPYARRQLASLANAIRKCRDANARDVLWCAFSRLIITKQAGVSLALDLAHSRPHRHFERAPIKPFASFLKAVNRVLENCLSSSSANRGPSPRIQLGDARALNLLDGTIDLVLTSPPYLNAIDYLRCSKFSLIWMGYSIGEIRQVRSNSVGTEVGDYEKSEESFSNKLLADFGFKHRLSGRKQAVLSRFISDMKAAVEEVSRVLVPGGKAIYVVGENTITGTYIENARIIAALARRAGLKLISRNSRELPPNRRYLPPPSRRKGQLDGRIRREVILKFVKRANSA
jgi:DNA modification methylase